MPPSSYHSGDLLLRANALAANSPGNAGHPESLQHEQVQPDDDEDGKDEGEEEEDHLVHRLVVLVNEKGAHGVFIVVGDVVRQPGRNAEDDDDGPHHQNGPGGVLHRPPLDRLYWMSNSQVPVQRHQH